jgi:ribosomal protein S27AE
MPEYIEREAVVARIKQTFCSDCDSYNGVKCRACLLDDALLQIEDEPAADVATVVHGEWLETRDKNKKQCSRCGVIHFIAQYPAGYKDFCPNCGVQMDEGKK